MCHPFFTPKKSCNCEDPCICTDNIYYSGPNLPGSGIQTNTILTVALEMLDNQILSLKEEIFNLTSTTTTVI